MDDEGAPLPLGPSWIDAERAWNFSLYSRHASGVTLLLYGDDLARPLLELQLHPIRNKSGRIWHCRVSEEPSSLGCQHGRGRVSLRPGVSVRARSARGSLSG